MAESWPAQGEVGGQEPAEEERTRGEGSSGGALQGKNRREERTCSPEGQVETPIKAAKAESHKSPRESARVK